MPARERWLVTKMTRAVHVKGGGVLVVVVVTMESVIHRGGGVVAMAEGVVPGHARHGDGTVVLGAAADGGVALPKPLRAVPGQGRALSLHQLHLRPLRGHVSQHLEGNVFGVQSLPLPTLAITTIIISVYHPSPSTSGVAPKVPPLAGHGKLLLLLSPRHAQPLEMLPQL